jgi:hypothetical protein
VSPDVRTAILGAGLAFCILFAGVSIFAIFDGASDFGVFLGIVSLIIVGMIMLGLFGAMRNPPRR